jgi:hypothetical protein
MSQKKPASRRGPRLEAARFPDAPARIKAPAPLAPETLARRVLENLRASQTYAGCLLEAGRAESDPRFNQAPGDVLVRLDGAMGAFEDAALLTLRALDPRTAAAARVAADLARQHV